MITLNQNIFIATITNLIAYTTYHDNYRLGDDIDKLLSVFRSDDVPMGDGKVVRTATLPSVQNLNPTSSTLLAVVKPNIAEQYIPVDEWKYIQLSINEYLMRGAFVNEGALGILVSYLVNTMQIAKRLYLYDRVRGLVLSLDSNANATKTTLTGMADDPNGTAQERNAIRTYNTNELYRYLISRIKQIGKGATIKDTSDGTSVKVYARAEDVVAIVSDELLASLDVDTLATLLNSNEITKNVKVELITMDYSAIGGGSPVANNVVFLLSRDKIQYGFFYQVATQFFDASILNTNNWLHFSDYCGFVNKAYAEVITCTNFA